MTFRELTDLIRQRADYLDRVASPGQAQQTRALLRVVRTSPKAPATRALLSILANDNWLAEEVLNLHRQA